MATTGKRSNLEKAAWIAGIVGALAAVIALYPVFAPPKAERALVHGAQASGVAIQQSQASGSQIGSSQQEQSGPGVQVGPVSGGSVTIYNHPGPASAPLPAASVPKRAPSKPVARLSAFNLNATHGYFTENESRGEPGIPKALQGTTSYVTTPKWSALARCVDEAAAKRVQPACGNVGDLAAVFDVTLLLEGEGPVVLNEVRARVAYATHYQGSADGVPTARIPSSARYLLKLPEGWTEGRVRVAKVAAIPPLLLERRRPARFEVALTHDCQAECFYVLQLQFVLSSGQVVSSKYFKLYWEMTG